MIATLVLIGTLTLTSYRATPGQTRPGCKSNNDCVTAIGENVSELGAAISQDLLHSGAVHYGDVLYISGYGYRIVFDTMHPRIHNAVDLFVYTKAEERRIGVRHVKVYKIGVTNELQSISK